MKKNQDLKPRIRELTHRDRLVDAVWGFVVGDALGVPYEFTPRELMDMFPATGMCGFGTHQQPPGTWSDDTSFMCCVLENLLESGTPITLKQKMLQCYRSGYLTAHGRLFDIGQTTRLALDGSASFPSGRRSHRQEGNGSLMRCLPYAFCDEYNEAQYKMVLDNRITHPSTICQWSCLFYVQLLRALLYGLDKLEAYHTAAAFLRSGWRIAHPTVVETTHRSQFERLVSDNFRLFTRSEIHSSGYVVHTLEASVWCFLNTENYADAVLMAVTLGQDTDTIAALTGGLAGTYYGKPKIPVEWLEAIVRPELIDGLLKKAKTMMP